MPITYEVRDGGAFVYTVATGEVTDQDLLDSQAAVLADPRIRPGFDELFDATMGRGVGLSQAAIEKMIDVDKDHTEKLRQGKCAVVVRSDVKLAEQFERKHSGPHQIMLFHNLDVALVWLGREGPSVR